MLEAFSFYGHLNTWVVAALLFPCGLVVGSFCTVLYHRIPRGESIVWPGSHCPTCHHSLGLVDLVPVLSYLAFRGRCRYCCTSISARYVVYELAAGLIGAGAGFFGGWSAGFCALGLLVTLVALVRRPGGRSNAGITLVEVLVAVSLLVLCMIPMLDLGAELRVGSAHSRQVAVMVARTKLEEMYDFSFKSGNNTWPSSPDEVWQDVGGYSFHLEWTVTPIAGYPATLLRQAVVTVSCDSCGIRPVSMTAVLAKSQ